MDQGVGKREWNFFVFFKGRKDRYVTDRQKKKKYLRVKKGNRKQEKKTGENYNAKRGTGCFGN